VENKHERYQKAMNIIDVLEGSQFAKIMQKGLILKMN
jgi:raw score 8.77